MDGVINGKQPMSWSANIDLLDEVTPEMWESVKPVLRKDGLPVGIIIYGTAGKNG